MRRRPQLVLSASQDLSDEVLAKARSHAAILARLGYAGAADFAVDNATEIAWKGGGRIVALPANPRTARSFTGDVWLDEFAYHTDPEGIRDGAFPMASRGGWRVRVFSTPNGAQGLFHQWATTPPPGWAVHETTVDDAIADGLAVDLAKLWSLCGGDERLFAQWYRCAFLDADLQYLPTALLRAALAWEGALPDLAAATWHAGLDVGRKRDVTALAIVAVVAGVAYVVAVLTCPRTAFGAQKALIRDARAVFRWDSLHIDETGIGAQLAEELVEEFGREEATPVQFTEQSKADLCTRTLRWLKNGKLRFPKDATGALLHKQGVSLRRVVTKAAHVTYAFPRTADGHGDEFTSLMLALKGAGEPQIVRGLGGTPLLAVA